jgi:aerobic carbon-monoxide dehydrogenase medium subunit
MYSVNYHRAASVADAVGTASGKEAKFLSGGMTLLPAMKTRLAAPSDVIDLMHIADLKGIKVSGRTLTIGAGVTHAEVATSREVNAVCPALCHLAAHIGDPHVRHRGTIGGSIANNDPAADYPAAMLALNATIATSKRQIPAEEFFTGLFGTALDEDEIVTSVSFTAPEKAGYSKFPNPASRYAIVGVFVAKDGAAVRVAVTGAGDDGVFRSPDIEAALSNSFTPGALDGLKIAPTNLMGDIHASPEYRANLIAVMAKRAVAAAG